MASAEGATVGDPAITNVADSKSITEITATTIGQEVPPHSVVTTVLAALAATKSSLASFAALPGIMPKSALRQVKLSMSLPRRTFVF